MSHNHQHKYDSEKGLKIAFFLNLFFTIAEFIGGYMTNSLAITSDALHDLGDSFSLGFAWLTAKIAKKSRTASFSYGLRRLTLASAFFNSVVLITGSIFILYSAVGRFINPEEANYQGMFIFAVVGIIVNTAAALRVSKGKTLNERLVSWHLIEDILGWVVVLIGSIIIHFTQWYIIDPILSVLITAYILFNVVKNFKKTIFIFLQGVPEPNLIESVEKKLMQVLGVVGVHDTHIWSLDGEENIISAHIVINENLDLKTCSHIKQEAKKIAHNMGIGHATFEFESKDEKCDDICK